MPTDVREAPAILDARSEAFDTRVLIAGCGTDPGVGTLSVPVGAPELAAPPA
jgi:hypothetical protein